VVHPRSVPKLAPTDGNYFRRNHAFVVERSRVGRPVHRTRRVEIDQRGHSKLIDALKKQQALTWTQEVLGPLRVGVAGIGGSVA
jgi:hypothetical protein